MLIINDIYFWHPISKATDMKTNTLNQTAALALFFLAGAAALWLLVHFTTAHATCCSQPASQLSLIKLI